MEHLKYVAQRHFSTEWEPNHWPCSYGQLSYQLSYREFSETVVAVLLNAVCTYRPQCSTKYKKRFNNTFNNKINNLSVLIKQNRLQSFDVSESLQPDFVIWWFWALYQGINIHNLDSWYRNTAEYYIYTITWEHNFLQWLWKVLFRNWCTCQRILLCHPETAGRFFNTPLHLLQKEKLLRSKSFQKLKMNRIYFQQLMSQHCGLHGNKGHPAHCLCVKSSGRVLIHHRASCQC